MPAPAMRKRLLDDRGDAGAIDVLHREDVHARLADQLLLTLVEVADADEHGVLGAAPSARSRRCATAPPARARAGRRAACRGRCRWSNVAGVFMSPCASTQMQAERLLVAAHEIGGRGHRSGRELVIAAEHERQSAVLEPAERRLVQLLADRWRSRGCISCGVTERLDFGNRRDEIAFVHDRDPERGQPLAEAGDAKRRRPHVDAAAVAAEVERDADDVDRAQRSASVAEMYHSAARLTSTVNVC